MERYVKPTNLINWDFFVNSDLSSAFGPYPFFIRCCRIGMFGLFSVPAPSFRLVADDGVFFWIQGFAYKKELTH